MFVNLNKCTLLTKIKCNCEILSLSRFLPATGDPFVLMSVRTRQYFLQGICLTLFKTSTSCGHFIILLQNLSSAWNKWLWRNLIKFSTQYETFPTPKKCRKYRSVSRNLLASPARPVWIIHFCYTNAFQWINHCIFCTDKFMKEDSHIIRKIIKLTFEITL